MSDFEFIPSEKQIQESNIFHFMQKHNIDSLDELSNKANNDLEWFWESVDKDLGIIWNSPYSKILDTTNGIMWSKWFVNGKTNIYSSSVEKFTKINPNKIPRLSFSSSSNANLISSKFVLPVKP